ncbi:MAG TPA: hypothetical protein VGD10_01600 [Allosphingosinicella sp.]|uniref:hypothetical protein n=1 Tax=Allosphingosinicella sp. TaxID=2823234 RepID=UPI002EDAFA8F
MHLLRRIERHLRQSGMPPTKFGREAVRDPRFVFDLRNGREPRSSTSVRVAAYLDRLEGRP